MLARRILRSVSARQSIMGCGSSKMAASEISEGDKTLVKKSWKDLTTVQDTTDLGVIMFTKLFDDNPEVKTLFSFMREGGASPTSEPFRKHAKGVLDTVGLAVSSIDDLVTLSPTVKGLGSKHHHYGTQAAHLQAVGAALMYTYETVLEDKFTNDIKRAWLAFYTYISKHFQEGIEEEARKQG